MHTNTHSLYRHQIITLMYNSVLYLIMYTNPQVHWINLYFNISTIMLKPKCDTTDQVLCMCIYIYIYIYIYIHTHTHTYTGLFEMIVRVLTTCHTQYTWDRSICFNSHKSPITNQMQQFSSLLSWRLFTAQQVSGILPPIIRSSKTAVAASGFTFVSW